MYKYGTTSINLAIDQKDVTYKSKHTYYHNVVCIFYGCRLFVAYNSIHECVSVMGVQFQGKLGDFECLVPMKKVCVPCTCTCVYVCTYVCVHLLYIDSFLVLLAHCTKTKRAVELFEVFVNQVLIVLQAVLQYSRVHQVSPQAGQHHEHCTHMVRHCVCERERERCHFVLICNSYMDKDKKWRFNMLLFLCVYNEIFINKVTLAYCYLDSCLIAVSY